MSVDPVTEADEPALPEPAGGRLQLVLILLLVIGMIGFWILGRGGMVNAVPETPTAVENVDGDPDYKAQITSANTTKPRANKTPAQ